MTNKQVALVLAVVNFIWRNGRVETVFDLAEKYLKWLNLTSKEK